MKIAFLVPCTSRHRPGWNDIFDSYLYRYSMQYAKDTIEDHMYKKITWYIGIDKDDRIYNEKELKRLDEKIKIISMKSVQGDVVGFWNELYKEAYDDGYDYFYQMGDDIIFKTPGWLSASIDILLEHNNIGVSGPCSARTILELTQALTHRTHYDIFGYFCHPAIKNIGEDEWTNYVYMPNHFYSLRNYTFDNVSNGPRYQMELNYSMIKFRVVVGRKILKNWIKTHPIVSIITPTLDDRFDKLKKLSKQLEEQTYNHSLIEWLIMPDRGYFQFKGTIKNRCFNKELEHTKKVPDKDNNYKNVLNLAEKRDFLINEAKGDIIMFFDDDDDYISTRIEESVKVLINSQLDLAGCWKINIMKEGGSLNAHMTHNYNNIYFNTLAFKKRYIKNPYTKRKFYYKAGEELYQKVKTTDSGEESDFIYSYDMPIEILDDDKIIKMSNNDKSSLHDFNIELVNSLFFRRHVFNY